MKEKIEHILFAYKAGSMNISEASQQVLDLFAVIKSVCDVKKWGETCTLTPNDECCSKCSHYVKQTGF